jgi:hypothetical protein
VHQKDPALAEFWVMNTLRLLQTLLIIHLTGLTLMAGTTAVSFIAYKRFLKTHIGGKDEFNSFKKTFDFTALLLLGAALLISSGVGLAILTHAHTQLWFQLKMGVVIALALNGFLFGSRQEQKIKQILGSPDSQVGLQLRRPVANVRTFYAIQLGLFLAVVILAVIKPG